LETQTYKKSATNDSTTSGPLNFGISDDSEVQNVNPSHAFEATVKKCNSIRLPAQALRDAARCAAAEKAGELLDWGRGVVVELCSRLCELFGVFRRDNYAHSIW
jgi:hypothetical protein